MSRTQRIGLAGAGNVGAALLSVLASMNEGDDVDVASIDGAAQSAILDAASVNPRGASRFRVVAALQGRYDIVFVCAGVQPADSTRPGDALLLNLEIALEVTSRVSLEGGVVVIVGSPVDQLAEAFCRTKKLDHRRVIGFGGELDRARLRYVLHRRGLRDSRCLVVGEHGLRSIPVYDGERDYEAIALEVQSFLPRIRKATPSARNLASGFLLGELLRALKGPDRLQCVSNYLEAYDLWLTWPHIVGEGGIQRRLGDLALGPKASSSLCALLCRREREGGVDEPGS